MKAPIYLDYNATTPHDPRVVSAMRPFWETEFGNPSSSHWYGIAPKRAVMAAREEVARLVGAPAASIVFTSGGTESNNHALVGAARALSGRGRHLITSSVEHPAIFEVCRYLAREGFETTYLPVDGTGRVDPDAVKDAIQPDTILISIMHANNEVGTLQPVEVISRIARDHGILMHTDAAQSLGKIPVQVDALGVDLLSIAGHKVYAPKGIGALYIRPGIEIAQFYHGAGQESGRRPGTENVTGIVGLGKACAIAAEDPKAHYQQLLATRAHLETLLTERMGDFRINGHPTERLPNTLSISFRGIASDRLLEEIGLGVAASAGAACHSGSVQISHVLEAMGVPVEWAAGTLRLSTGRMTTMEEVERAATVIRDAVHQLRSLS